MPRFSKRNGEKRKKDECIVSTQTENYLLKTTNDVDEIVGWFLNSGNGNEWYLTPTQANRSLEKTTDKQIYENKNINAKHATEANVNGIPGQIEQTNNNREKKLWQTHTSIHGYLFHIISQ